MSNLLLFTFADQIGIHFKKSYPECLFIVEEKKSATVVSLCNLAVFNATISLELIKAKQVEQSRTGKDLVVKINYSYCKKRNQNGFDNIKIRSLRRGLDSVLNEHHSFCDSIVQSANVAIGSLDIFDYNQYGPVLLQELLVCKSSQLALRAFLKGKHEVDHLKKQVHGALEGLQRRPKTDRNLVYLIFICILEIHITTELASRKFKLEQLKKSLIFTLNFRRATGNIWLPRDPLNKLRKDFPMRDNALPVSNFTKDSTFTDIIKYMRKD